MTTTKASEKSSQAGPHFIDLASWTSPPPKREWLVEDLIPIGAVTAMYADGGSGKSMAALTLMVAMAAEEASAASSWLGVKTLRGASVGLFVEEDEHELVRRLQRIANASGVDFALLARKVAVVPGGAFDPIVAQATASSCQATQVMQSLLDKAISTGARLIVLDYAAAVFGGDELNRTSVSDFMRLLNTLASDHGVAILLLGHPSMDGMRGGRGTSGSTAWRNQSRSFLLLERVPKCLPDGRTHLLLTLSKSNYAQPGKKLDIAFDGTVFHPVEVDQRAARTRAMTRSHSVALKALETAIAQSGVSKKDPSGAMIPVALKSTWRDLSYSMGISVANTGDAKRKAFQNAVSALTQAGIAATDHDHAWLVRANE